MDDVNPSILIVDSVPGNRELLSTIVRDGGYRPRPVSEARHALEAVKIDPPSLALLTIDLPDMDGYQLCEQLKKDRGSSDIPIVFVSASTDALDRVRAFEIGAVDFITEPFHGPEIQTRIATHIQLRQTRRELERVRDALDELREAELALDRTEALFGAVLEGAPNAILVFDKQLIVRVANAAAAEMFGYDQSGLIGRSVHDLVPSRFTEHPHYCQRYLAAPASRRMTQEREYFAVRANGQEFPVEVNLSPVTTDDGQSVVAIVRDITEEKALVRERTAKLETAYQDLREREETLQRITGSAGSAIIMIDNDGLVTFWNPSAVKIFGWTENEIIGKDLHQCLTRKEYQQAHAKAFPEFQKTGKGAAIGATVELAAIRKNGEEFPVELSLSSVKVRGTWHAIGIVNDISERRQAEEALRVSEEKYRRLVTEISDGVCEIDRDGRFTFVNDAMARIHGYDSVDHLKGATLFDMVAPEALAESSARFAASMSTGQFSEELEIPIVRRDGSRGVISVRPTLIYEGDTIVGSRAVVRDITEAQRAQEELRKLSRAIDASPASVVITDSHGKLEYVNPAFRTLTGYSKEEVLGNNPRLLKSGVQTPELYRELWETITTGKKWHGQLCNKKKNGELFWEDTFISPVADRSGAPSHYVGVKIDITRRKQVEAELRDAKNAADQANQAKSDFLANMSHEIRTPMNAVLGMAHLALQTKLTPKQRDYLGKIQGAAKGLLGIINHVLDVSKIEAGKLEVETVPFDLREVMDSLAGQVGVAAADKSLRLYFRIEPDVPSGLKGDPLRLRQVLLNLASNAVKFTEKGQVEVSVERVRDGADTVELRFMIRDTGIGLTERQLKLLFKPFSQADASTTRRFGGTGLGLSIVRRLVELMGGEIGVESEFGKGSAFHFTIAFERVELLLSRPPPARDIRGMPVLLVSDRSTERGILRTLLSDLSFQVDTASTWEEATECLSTPERSGTYEIVVVQLAQDQHSWSEVARLLNQVTERPPQVVFVADGSEVLTDLEYAAADAVVRRPVTPSRLLDSVMQALGIEHAGTNTKAATSSEEQSGTARLRGARVLLVEDNEINQQVAQELLANVGVEVTAVDNGQLAVEAVTQESFDVVLMDVQMPIMDGYTATRRIRDDARFTALPIIAMTASAMSGDRERAMAAGMTDHVAKPVEPEQLFGALCRALPDRPGTHAAQVCREGETLPSETSPSEDALVIAGVDTATGLRRVGGNLRTYRKILGSFTESFGSVVAQIRSALDDGASEEAQRLAHTVKGVAGNLGAEQVFEAAGQVERCIKQQESEQYGEVLGQLEATLCSAIQSITEALARDETPSRKVSEAADRTTTSGDTDVAAQMNQLAELLRSGDADAVDGIDKLAGIFAHGTLAQDLAALRRCVERWDL